MNNSYNTRQTLIAKIKDQHDETSWEEFIRLYERYIYVVVMKMGVPVKDVEDVCQRILLVIWEKLPDFEYEPKKCKFRSWMNRVTFNCVSSYKRSDYYHKKKLELFSAENAEELSLSSELDQSMEVQWKQHMTKLALDNISHELSDASLQCFEMFYKGLPVSEICEQLDIKKNSAYVLRKRVIDRLRIELIRLDNELS
jgi:RNA polymerase sigma factor (sigma-70 family)